MPVSEARREYLPGIDGVSIPSHVRSRMNPLKLKIISIKCVKMSS